jgi:uncharacterized phiE125 gp8 family phage protein
MLNRLKTAPATEPVTLAEVRAFMGISQVADTVRDSIITTQIVAARTYAESYTQRAFISQSWYTYSDWFMDSFDLVPDVQSITSVKYYDKNNALQTLSNTIYYTDLVSSRLLLGANQYWPDTYLNPNSVIIEYVSGFTIVPQQIKQAILFLVAHWENYQGSIEGARISTVPYAVNQLLEPYIDQRGFG